MKVKFAVLLLLAFCAQAQAAPEKIKIGKFESRALWTATSVLRKMPAVILIPGSGPNGPEEMIPGSMTADNKDTSVFESVSRPFIQKNWNVLALGKPGIEFHTGWKPETYSYNKDLYVNLSWNQFIENLREGIQFLKQQPSVDSTKIYILGHSQGTQVAVDYAAQYNDIAGLILIGYSAENYKDMVDWQIFKRPIEHFVATDVDTNRDGFVSQKEVAKWPGPLNLDDVILIWNFRGKDRISYAEIEEDLRKESRNQKIVNAIRQEKYLSDGIYDRAPLYKKTAALKTSLYVYTGDLDLLTPAKEALELKRLCKLNKKKSCEVTIVKGLGHGFSPPRGPRRHPLLDITVGPVEDSFLNTLAELTKRL